jgi:nucleoside-diphosphate-sugar epimerase
MPMIESNELIVISGGTGWIGRSLIEQIINTKFCPIKQVVLVSSAVKNIEISNNIFKTHVWENLKIDSHVNLYFDLAFQTQEKLATLGKNKFMEENRKIIENSVRFINLYKPRSTFLASSGAIYGANYSSTPTPISTYGELKYLQELQISKVTQHQNLNLLIGRIFNISGGNINKLETFAIAQMIKSAIDHKYIKVFADHQVFRRYSDVSQLTRLILQLLRSGSNCVFDSGGPLIEMRELAALIKKVVDPSAKLELTVNNSKSLADEYYSRSDQYEVLLKRHLGEEPIKIEDQILNSFNYIKNFKI